MKVVVGGLRSLLALESPRLDFPSILYEFYETAVLLPSMLRTALKTHCFGPFNVITRRRILHNICSILKGIYDRKI